jgi:hypothetical protein
MDLERRIGRHAEGVPYLVITMSRLTPDPGLVELYFVTLRRFGLNMVPAKGCQPKPVLTIKGLDHVDIIVVLRSVMDLLFELKITKRYGWKFGEGHEVQRILVDNRLSRRVAGTELGEEGSPWSSHPILSFERSGKGRMWEQRIYCRPDILVALICISAISI